MNKYCIEYSGGGDKSIVYAEDHMQAIVKDAKKSLPKTKVRFFETYPQLEPLHFIVTDEKGSAKYYKMIIQT